MKQFDLQKYIINPYRNVVTRDSRPARIICIKAKGNYSIVTLILTEEEEFQESYNEKGTCINSNKSDNDLFFAPTKHEGWANIYRINNITEMGTIYATKEEALVNALGTNYIDTVHIEWEE